MPAIRHDAVLLNLIRRVDLIQSALRRVTVNLPLFDVASENTPDPLSADQDDYVIGNYDILRISPLSTVTITGFDGGIKGRSIEIVNIGPGNLIFANESASSDAENRIVLPYTDITTIIPDARISFYYDSTQERWIITDAPIVQGLFGKSALIGHSVDTINTVVTNTETLLTPDTVFYDAWNLWDSVNFRFVIPSGEDGLYLFFISASWYHEPGSPTLRQVRVLRNQLENIGSIGIKSQANTATNISSVGVDRLVAGDYVDFWGRQDSGSDLDINRHTSLSPIAFCMKVQ